MNKRPRATKPFCRAGQRVHRIIVLLNSARKIVRLADVQFAVRIAQNVDMPRGRGSVHDRDLAPEVGFEPTTNRLTADRSTTELLWNNYTRRRAA